MHIHAAEATDLAKIQALFEELDALHRERLPERFRASVGPARSEEHLLEVIRGPDTAILVGEDAGEPLGFVHLAVRASPELPMVVPRRFVAVENLVVAKRAHRLGIGRALMAAAEAWTRSHGGTSIELTAYAINDEATTFYQALGYRVLSYRLSREIE